MVLSESGQHPISRKKKPTFTTCVCLNPTSNENRNHYSGKSSRTSIIQHPYHQQSTTPGFLCDSRSNESNQFLASEEKCEIISGTHTGILAVQSVFGIGGRVRLQSTSRSRWFSWEILPANRRLGICQSQYNGRERDGVHGV
jgi:hypothetical protein